MSRIANRCPKGFWDSHFPSRWDCMGHSRISHTVTSLYHNPYPADSDGTAWDIPRHPTLSPSTLSFCFGWDCIEYPRISHSVPCLYLYHPSHPTVPTNGWDCMGRPRTSHSVPSTSQFLLSNCTNNRQMG